MPGMRAGSCLAIAALCCGSVLGSGTGKRASEFVWNDAVEYTMDHEAELQAFIDAAARQGNEISIESAERIYLGLVMMRGVDASMGMKLMTCAMPHAMPTGKGLFGDARALAQALYDIREAEGEAVRVQCDETLKVLLTTWRAEDERAAAAAAAS